MEDCLSIRVEEKHVARDERVHSVTEMSSNLKIHCAVHYVSPLATYGSSINMLMVYHCLSWL